ncbi:alpha/beta fold hydrolase [Brevundimonas aurifodinae]|uniref:Alpha/beta hydrolase n=2 Tax=Brevundimonas TaxID=41275 RepID=A0ABV1NJ40_9CAUL|nr:MAG: alpha/beta hydrolase [Brevundimonas sp. 12-68-7]OYX34834.1 MAG: alpha/beta hydrolase [Brevundimonas subvibrioides]
MDAARLFPPRRLMVPLTQRGGEMAVLDFGDNKRPVDLVFSHANGFNAATYRSILAPLAASFRILAPDLRGHGHTRLPTRTVGRRDWSDHRDDLLALLEAFPGPPVVLAGHSMGGTASLLAAARAPERVSRLVLFDPVIWGGLTSIVLRAPGLRRLSERYPLVRASRRRRALFDSREQALEAYRGRGAFRGWPDPVLIDYLSDGLLDTPDGGFRLACAPEWEASNYMSQAHDPWRAMRDYGGPVRVLKAETGSISQVPDRPRGLANVTAEAVPGTHHLFPMVRADLVRDALFDAAV